MLKCWNLEKIKIRPYGPSLNITLRLRFRLRLKKDRDLLVLVYSSYSLILLIALRTIGLRSSKTSKLIWSILILVLVSLFYCYWSLPVVVGVVIKSHQPTSLGLGIHHDSFVMRRPTLYRIHWQHYHSKTKIKTETPLSLLIFHSTT